MIKEKIGNLRDISSSLKQELEVYRLAAKDRRTPRISRIFLGLALAYALMPFDLIPDWIPVLGHIDDIIIVPLLLFIALKFIPKEVIKECRTKVVAKNSAHK